MCGVAADRNGRPCVILSGNINFSDYLEIENRAIECVNACAIFAPGFDPCEALVAAREAMKAAVSEFDDFKNGPINEGDLPDSRPIAQMRTALAMFKEQP